MTGDGGEGCTVLWMHSMCSARCRAVDEMVSAVVPHVRMTPTAACTQTEERGGGQSLQVWWQRMGTLRTKPPMMANTLTMQHPEPGRGRPDLQLGGFHLETGSELGARSCCYLIKHSFCIYRLTLWVYPWTIKRKRNKIFTSVFVLALPKGTKPSGNIPGTV